MVFSPVLLWLGALSTGLPKTLFSAFEHVRPSDGAEWSYSPSYLFPFSAKHFSSLLTVLLRRATFLLQLDNNFSLLRPGTAFPTLRAAGPSAFRSSVPASSPPSFRRAAVSLSFSSLVTRGPSCCCWLPRHPSVFPLVCLLEHCTPPLFGAVLVPWLFFFWNWNDATRRQFLNRSFLLDRLPLSFSCRRLLPTPSRDLAR